MGWIVRVVAVRVRDGGVSLEVYWNERERGGGGRDVGQVGKEDELGRLRRIVGEIVRSRFDDSDMT